MLPDDEISISMPKRLDPIPRLPASVKGYVKHVRCDGARFHVLHWSSQGRHCSEPKCIVNYFSVAMADA